MTAAPSSLGWFLSPFHVKAYCAAQESEKGEDDVYKYGTCGMQGWRTEMVSPSAARALALHPAYASQLCLLAAACGPVCTHSVSSLG